MYLDVFDDNPYDTNCWLLAAEGSAEAVVVDPGFEPDTLHRMLDAAGLRPVAVLLSHAHVDHAEQAGIFAGDELPVLIHEADAVAFDDISRWNPGFSNPLAPVQDLRRLEDGEVLSLGGFSVDVLHTPGHTPGHCCFRIDSEDLFLSGDLVFAGSIGRSDFANSDPAAMRASLARFLALPDDLEVLPGHGRRTTVEQERSTNPFLLELV
jgi:hydroxyacylglutathione hydrolase